MSVYEEKLDLYKDYYHEGERKGAWEKTLSDGAIEGIANGYINSEQHKWRNIWSLEGSHVAGFLILCKHPEYYPDAKYCVTQAYIRPEDRRMGLMENCVVEHVKSHPGIYAVDVHENTVGLAFWDHIFVDKCGYKKRELPDTAQVMAAYEPCV